MLHVATFELRLMKFTWEAKNRRNIREHGFDLADGEEMFRALMLARADTREDYGEERWIGIGMIRERCAFLAFSQPSADTIRVISLRKANHEERNE